MTIRVVIAHRSRLVRDALRVLAASQGIVVVGEAQGRMGLLDMCANQRPDVVVSEADYGDGTEIESYIPHLMAAGARVGVISPDASPAEVVETIAILAGQGF